MVRFEAEWGKSVHITNFIKPIVFSSIWTMIVYLHLNEKLNSEIIASKQCSAWDGFIQAWHPSQALYCSMCRHKLIMVCTHIGVTFSRIFPGHIFTFSNLHDAWKTVFCMFSWKSNIQFLRQPRKLITIFDISLSFIYQLL